MNNASFTFIMPVYNTKESYLRFAIDSILNQKYDNYELIIVDDGSNEKTKQILENYKDKALIIHKKNGGISKARISAFPYIKNDYVILMDSDDYIKDDALMVLDNIIKNNNPDIILYDFARFKNNDVNNYYDKHSFLTEGIKTKDEILLQLCQLHINSFCSKILKKDLLEGLEENINTSIVNGEDLQQSTYLLLKANSYYYTDKIIQLYRVLDEQRSYYNINNIIRDINWLVRPLEMLKDTHIENKYLNIFYSSSVNNIVFNAFRICILAQNKKERNALLTELNNSTIINLLNELKYKLPIHLKLLYSFLINKQYSLLSLSSKIYDRLIGIPRI